jgi:hypothetical protein
MSSKVVAIDSAMYNQTSFGSTESYPSSDAVQAASPFNDYPAIGSNAQPRTPTPPLSPMDLYSEQLDDSRVMKAIALIERVRVTLQGAVGLDPGLEFIEFDQAIMSARALLLNAFQYRQIGEGYASIVNATSWALANRQTGGPTRKQLNVISTTLKHLVNGPYLHFDTAMRLMDELELAELDIEPPSLDLLTSELDA